MFEEVAPSLDDLGGAFRSAEKWAFRLGSSDALFSWLKENYPDTLAGRHVIDHKYGMDTVIIHVTRTWLEAGLRSRHGDSTLYFGCGI